MYTYVVSRANARYKIRNTRLCAARVDAERGAAINVERGRPCDRRPANQLFSFVVPPSSFPVRVHAEAAGTDWPQDIARILRARANYDRPIALKGNAEFPLLTVRIGRGTPRESQTVANAFICGVAILVIRRADVPSKV